MKRRLCLSNRKDSAVHLVNRLFSPPKSQYPACPILSIMTPLKSVYTIRRLGCLSMITHHERTGGPLLYQYKTNGKKWKVADQGTSFDKNIGLTDDQAKLSEDILRNPWIEQIIQGY